MVAIDYDAVIAEFRQVIADAEAAIRVLERAHPAGLVERPRYGVPNRICELLRGYPPAAALTTEQIRRGLGDVNIRTLRGALLRMAGKRLTRRERGRYSLSVAQS